jgi:hypothetical protein
LRLARASLALFALPLAACGGSSGADGGAPPDAAADQAIPVDAAPDQAGPIDAASADGPLCLAQVPQTHLVEEICQTPGPGEVDCLAGPGDVIIPDGY